TKKPARPRQKRRLANSPAPMESPHKPNQRLAKARIRTRATLQAVRVVPKTTRKSLKRETAPREKSNPLVQRVPADRTPRIKAQTTASPVRLPSRRRIRA